MPAIEECASDEARHRRIIFHADRVGGHHTRDRDFVQGSVDSHVPQLRATGLAKEPTDHHQPEATDRAEEDNLEQAEQAARQPLESILDELVKVCSEHVDPGNPLGDTCVHLEGTYGHTQKTLHELFDGVDAATRRRVTLGSFAELFPHVPPLPHEA